MTLASLLTVENVAVAFGIACVYLAAKENVWNWPTGIVNVGLYVIVFFRAKLYADMGLQVIYLALAVYGWWHWLHGAGGDAPLPVSRTPRRTFVLLGAVALVGSAILGTILRLYTDAALPYMDSSLAVVSLAAQYMLTRKLIENWLVWIAVDVVYVGMFIFKGLLPTALQYGVFLILAVLGWVEWRRAYRAIVAVQPSPVAA